MKALVIAAIGSLAATGPAFAKDGLSYSYVEGGYLNTNLDRDSTLGVDVDGDGFGFDGAFAITPMLHGYAEYTNQHFDLGIHLQTLETGLGLNWSVASNVDLIGRVAYARSEIEHFGHESGYALQAGVRALVAPRFELEGIAHYVDLDDSGDNTTFRGTARYSFTDNFSVTAGAELDSDAVTWLLGGRYSF